MTRKHPAMVLLPAAFAALAMALPAQAGADSDTCISGFVWREATPGDHVCVSPNTRSSVAQENANPTNHRSPDGGAYGPDTCATGFVWREAFDGDTICVTSEERKNTLADNAATASRIQGTAPAGATGPPGSKHVVFEITSPDPDVSVDKISVFTTNRTWVGEPLPWSYEIDITDPTSLDVRAWNRGPHPLNCEITVDGVVVHGPHDSHGSAAVTMCQWFR